jgi:hypothetical protein
MEYMKQQTQANTPDPDGEFLRSLLSDMKTKNAKQKCIFKIGVVNLIDEILDNTESDDHPLGWRKRQITISTVNSLQEERNISVIFNLLGTELIMMIIIIMVTGIRI